MLLSSMLNRFNFGEISPLLAGRVDFVKYNSGARCMKNFIPQVQGPVKKRSGTKYVAQTKYQKPTCLIRFEYSKNISYVIEVGEYYMRFYHRGGRVMKDGQIYEIKTPYKSEELYNENGELNLKWVQSGDVLYIVTPHNSPKKLCRYGHNHWEIQDLKSWSNLTNHYKTLTKTVKERIKITNEQAFQMWLNAGGNSFKIPVNYYAPESKPSEKISSYIYSNTEGILPYSLANKRYSTKGIHTFPQLSSKIEFVANDGYYEISERQVTEQVFDKTTGATRPNATAITLFRERLCLAAGQTIWMSAAGALEDFKEPAKKPLADDPIEITIYSEQMDNIAWLCPSSSLIVGTYGGEFIISEHSSIEPFGPNNIKVTPQTTYGSTNVQALRISGAVLFIQRAGRRLREICYEYSGDRYIARDLSIAAEHLTKDGIKQIVWQSEPSEILWCLSKNGSLIGFTYNREQEMTAWHQHELGSPSKNNAIVESMAVVSGDNSSGDELWLLVKRNTKSGIKMFIEYINPEENYLGKSTNSYFVDCGLTYQGSKAYIISGLYHLEGEEVDILADGAIHPRQIVKNGRITLTYPAETVHIGLPYEAILETMDLEISLNDGGFQSRLKKINSAQLKVYESLGGEIGTEINNLENIYFDNKYITLDSATELFTGNLTKLKFVSSYDRNCRLIIRHASPLPFTLISIILEVNPGGK